MARLTWPKCHLASREGARLDTRLYVLSIGSFVGTMESFVLPGLLPSMASEMNLTASQAGWPRFRHSLACGLAGPVLASCRRSGQALFALRCGIGLRLQCPVHGRHAAFALIVAGRIVLRGRRGAVHHHGAGNRHRFVSAGVSRARRASVVVTGGTLAVAIGAPLGALLAERYGWRVTYSAVGPHRADRRPHDLAPPAARNHRAAAAAARPLAVLGEPGMPTALLMSFLLHGGAFMPAIWVAPISRDAMGMPSVLLPVVPFANGLGAIVGGIVGGQLTDRFRPIAATSSTRSRLRRSLD